MDFNNHSCEIIKCKGIMILNIVSTYEYIAFYRKELGCMSYLYEDVCGTQKTMISM